MAVAAALSPLVPASVPWVPALPTKAASSMEVGALACRASFLWHILKPYFPVSIPGELSSPPVLGTVENHIGLLLDDK